MKRLYILSIAVLAAVIIGLAWADQMTFTTYYPAPYGVYRQLNVSQSLGLGDTSGNNQWQISPTIGTDLQLNWTDNAGNSKTSITIEEPVSSAPSPALRIANNGDISMPNLTLDGSHLKIHEETEDTAQTAVGADYGVFYVDSTDNQPYYLDENGTKTKLNGGGGAFSAPAYDSGWQPYNNQPSIPILHNINADPNKMFVDMQTQCTDWPIASTSTGISNIACHRELVGSGAGVSYMNLTNNSITLTIDSSMGACILTQYRVRIWKYD